MRRCVILLVAGAGLAAAVPAAASHHPPNSVTGLVTMSATRQGVQLILNYSVVQQACTNPSCDVNFGKPYRIDVFVDEPDMGSGVAYPLPTLTAAPSEWCKTGFEPLVDCNVPGRDQRDPSDALPLTGTIKVRVGTAENVTAEIVVAGYSLNTYQEGIPVPPHDCGPADTALRAAEREFISTEELFSDLEQQYKEELRQFIKIENAAFMWFRVGHVYVVARTRALRDFRNAQTKLAVAATARSIRRTALDRARSQLAACLGQGTADKLRPATAARASSCTDAEWSALIKRGQSIKLKNTAPLVRKILAKQKARKRAEARRDIKRLHALLKPELKALRTLKKSVAACG